MYLVLTLTFPLSFLIWNDTAVSVERIIELKSFQVSFMKDNEAITSTIKTFCFLNFTLNRLIDYLFLKPPPVNLLG